MKRLTISFLSTSLLVLALMSCSPEATSKEGNREALGAHKATPTLLEDRIAFTLAPPSNNPERYIENIFSFEPRIVITPRWSPDDLRIAFVSEHEGVGYGLYIMDASGSNLTRLTDGYAFLGRDIVGWLNENTIINEVVVSQYWLGGTFKGGLYIIDVLGSSRIPSASIEEETVLNVRLEDPYHTDISDTAWSPNRRQIAFVSGPPFEDHLYIMDEDGNNVRLMINDGFRYGDLDWSPDGERLVFVSNRHETEDIECQSRDCQWDLFILEVDSGEVIALTNDEFIYQNPDWSPDGKYLAVASNFNDPSPATCDLPYCRWDLVLLSLEGGINYQLTAEESAEHFPDWSSDGMRIVYVGSNSISILDMSWLK